MWTFSDDQLAALHAFCADRQLLRGRLSVEPVGDGHSNLTFLVSDGERRLVVRRPPPPPNPAGAHDVLREARLLIALAHTDVPVPQVLALAPAGELLDTDCYLMTFVEGVVVTDRLPAALAEPTESRRVGLRMVDTLATLHGVDWSAAGLADFGRPEGFNRRHLTRLSRLVTDSDGELPAHFVILTRRLHESAPPESSHSLVHNDFRIGNLLLDADAPARVAAVLDWELATLGDPWFDLGYLLASVPMAGEPLTPIQKLGLAQANPGFPARQELADHYAQITRRPVAGLGWYVALANWKLAVLYEYSRRRGVDPYYQDPESVLAFLAAATRALDSLS